MEKQTARIILAVSLVLLISLSFNSCAPAAYPSTTSPNELTKPAPGAEPTTAAAPVTIETTDDDIPAKSHLGQLFVQYPIQINPGASKTVIFNITFPAELASLSSDTLPRDVRGANNPRPLGNFTEHTSLILVGQRMRVELIAPNFTVRGLYPDEQDLDLLNPNARANWGWTITAPDLPNEYVLVIKVSISGKEIPVWVGSFDVTVEAPPPTPAPLPSVTPSPTPIPFSERFLQNLADNSAALIGAILTAVVALIGLYFQQRKPNSSKK